MNELPLKLQVEITSLLPLTELIRLRTISKSWKSLIDISTKKKELILFVDTNKLPLKWEYNKEKINEDNILIVKTNYMDKEHFINFFKYLERLFIFDPTSTNYDLNKLIESFCDLKHLQTIINFSEFTMSTINFGGYRLETLTINSFLKFDKINYLNISDLKSVKLNYLSIDFSFKNGPVNLFKTLKYLKIQELNLEYQQKLEFNNLEILVCLKPFTILLKNMPKLKQIHFPYFYTDVVKYSNCLKQMDVQDFTRKNKIEFFFSGFKCSTNDYLGSLFRAFMLNLKPFRFYDTINHEVFKLITNKTMDLDFSREPIDFIYTDEFGEQIKLLDNNLIQQLTINRYRLVRILNKLENNHYLLNSVVLFENVESLIFNEQLSQDQLNILPAIFLNLVQLEQVSKYQFTLAMSFEFLAEFKCLRKFILGENFLSKESMQKILFENKSKLFRVGELNRFLFEINSDESVQFIRKRSSNNSTYYFNKLYNNKRYDTKEEFKIVLFVETDYYIKYEQNQNAFPLGVAEMYRR